jgi:putative CocE/NonD family hydrolase
MPGSEPIYAIKAEHNVAARMRDGALLHADIYRPEAVGTFPALLIRTPYDKTQAAMAERSFFASRGYIVVVQDVRGRFASEGEFYPFIHEASDGHDTVQWVSRLPACDGNVGMSGQSYPGLVQYFAAAEAPAALRTIVPVSGPVSYFEDFVYRGGVFELGWMLAYFVHMSRDTLARKKLLDREWARLESYMADPAVRFSPLTAQAYAHLPLADWTQRLHEGAPYFADYLRNWTYGSYWERTELRERLHSFDVPVFHVGSWYDIFQPDTLKMYTGMREHAASERARTAQKLLMGPWAHLLPYSVPTSRGTGEIDFGREALIELHELQLRWYDHFLKHVDNRVLDEAPVRIFVMGDNRWRDEHEWPLARTRYTELYLHSGGAANSLRGDGSLSFGAPSDEPPDRFIYDPANPVPTRGGTTLGLAGGVFDQREIEQREDVLVYTSAVLSADLEVTGPIVLILHAASSAPDTDFTAKLCDVRADGYAQNVVEGVVRARFRASRTNPSPIKAGEVYCYRVDLWATRPDISCAWKFHPATFRATTAIKTRDTTSRRMPCWRWLGRLSFTTGAIPPT